MLPEWGDCCFHCGSDQHTRNDCKEFQNLMANVGVPKKDWKPPPGYKSAIGKARDAARLKLKDAPKPKAKAATKKKILNAIKKAGYKKVAVVPQKKAKTKIKAKKKA